MADEFPFKFELWNKIWVPQKEKGFALDETLGLYLPEGVNRRSRYYSFLGDSGGMIPMSIIDFGGSDAPSAIERRKKREAEKEAKDRELEQKLQEERKIMANPILIKEQLDRYVIGQEEAKKDLAIAFAEMYERALTDVPNYQRSNILLLGPTGVGKTKLLDTLSSLYSIPMEVIKVGRMVQPGIVGKTFEDVFRSLKRKLNKKEGKSERPMGFMGMFMAGLAGDDTPSKLPAIIYLDELDKICSNGRYRSNIYGDALQDELISLMDNTEIEGVDTSRVLYVGGGAFEGLIGTKKTHAVGFGATTPSHEMTSYVSEDALESFGMKKELIGRFPLRTILQSLSKDDLAQILTEAEDSIIKTTAEFYKQTKDVTLTFSPQAINYMAEKSLEAGTGARALNGMVERVLRPYKFDIESYKGEQINITLDDVKRVC